MFSTIPRASMNSFRQAVTGLTIPSHGVSSLRTNTGRPGERLTFPRLRRHCGFRSIHTKHRLLPSSPESQPSGVTVPFACKTRKTGYDDMDRRIKTTAPVGTNASSFFGLQAP